MAGETIIVTAAGLYRWHRSEVATVTTAGDLPVLQLGDTVLCGLGRTTIAKHKMSTPKSFGGKSGIVTIVHVETDVDGTLDVELGVRLGNGIAIAWFPPDELTLVPDIREADHAC